MKQFWLNTLIVIVLLLIVGSASYYFIIKTTENITSYKREVTELKKQCRENELREERLLCMTKVLIMVYGLSQWEAHYYSVIFDDFSIKFNIPWEIYPAIIKIESNFRPSLVSPKSAKGMMQILEGTGEMVAKQIDMNYVKGETLWNDFSNIILGCFYLSFNIRDKGLDGGVQSYLGGPAYLVSAKANNEVFKYLGEYKTTVAKEFKTLQYMYRGIVAESGFNYKEVHPSKYQDSISVNVTLFSTIK